MERYVAGQQQAFDDLYRALAPRLLASLMPLTRDHAHAEDLVQTTFLKMHRARHRYIAGSPVFPWAYVIAKRSLFDESRPLSARCEHLSSDGDVPEIAGPALEEQLDVRAGLHHALSLLPAPYRDAIELTKLSGLSGGEAAHHLQTTAAAIKQRVHRGYALLRKLLRAPSSTSLALEA